MENQMPNNVPNSTPNTAPTSSNTAPKSGVGSIVATIIIIILIVIGALYFWGKRVENSRANQAAYDSATTIDQTASAAEAAQIQNVSTDDSITALQAELESTNTSNLSTGI